MKKLVTFRLDADLMAHARTLACRENRTLTNFIETILKQALASKDRVIALSPAPEANPDVV